MPVAASGRHRPCGVDGGGCTASRTAHVLARLGRPGGLGDRILEAREPDLDIAAVGGSLADATTAALGS
jgi:hypothetical protein